MNKKSGLLIMLTGTHQNLMELAIFKSGESRDLPFQNPRENSASTDYSL